MALAGEDAADRARPAQATGDADHLGLVVDFTLACVGVGVGEVGRAAEHRHREARRGDRLADPVDITVVEAREEAVEHLQAVGVEAPRHLDPVEDRHRPLAGNLVEVTLGEGGNPRRHDAGLRLVVGPDPAGRPSRIRPAFGRCSLSEEVARASRWARSVYFTEPLHIPRTDKAGRDAGALS
jgi:hypothetical protein